MPSTTTIFDRMSALARELGAINLGQGFPDLPEPAELIEAARRALTEKSNQYPPMRGLAELRRAVAGYYAREQGLEVREEEVIVTSGATEALAAAILAFVRPGDEAVLFQPFYDAYLPLVERAGGVARMVSLVPPHWTLPLDRLEAAIGPKTRLVILNTPNNPTGTVIDRATLEALGAIVRAARPDPAVRRSLGRHDLRRARAMSRRSRYPRCASGRSKSARRARSSRSPAGRSAGPSPPRRSPKRSPGSTSSSLSPPRPRCNGRSPKGSRCRREWHAAHRARYEAARDRLVDGLTAAGYVAAAGSHGTWFVIVDLAASGLPPDDEAVAERLIREAGVAVDPGPRRSIGDDPERGYLRLCFAKEDATLDEAIERLAQFRLARSAAACAKLPVRCFTRSARCTARSAAAAAR